jgi:hypothetical protein
MGTILEAGALGPLQRVPTLAERAAATIMIWFYPRQVATPVEVAEAVGFLAGPGEARAAKSISPLPLCC